MPEQFKATWPMYFAATDSDGQGKVVYRKGQPFIFQDKNYVRGIGGSFGCPDAWSRGFADLPYVQHLDVRDETMVKHIMEKGLDYDEAKALMTGGEPKRRGRPPKSEQAAA